MIDAAKAADAHGFIMNLPEKWDAPVARRGYNFSGGQRQRLSITRALASQPRIIVLDDSTSALDASTEGREQAAIPVFTENITTIYIAQRISAVIDLDKIVLLENGEIVAMGTHEKLMQTSPLYQEIYESQLGSGITAAVYLLFSLLAERIYADLATRALAKLQNHLFSHLQSLSLNFFDRQPLGELLSRVANDSEVISLFYEQGVSPIIRSFTQIVMILLVMLIADWRLTLVALIVVPFMLIAALVIERASSPTFAALQDELGSLSGFQEETLSGHKVIISKRRQEWAVEQSNAQAKEGFDLGSKAFFNALLQYPLTMSFSTFQIVLVMVAGGLMVIEGITTLGLVIAFSGYAALLASPLSQLANLTSTTLNAVAGGRRVFEIIDEQAQITDAPDAVDYEFKGGRIEFQDVDFSYVPGRKILSRTTS